MRPTINEVRGTGQITHMYDWDVGFTLFPSGIAPGLTSAEFNMRCESTDQPSSSGETVELNMRGHKVNYPGRMVPIGIITMTMIEYSDSKVAQFLKAWRNACWEIDTAGAGTQLNKADLEAQIRIQRFDVTGAVVKHFDLFGCFLETFESGGTLDGVTSDPLRPTMTLRYDYFTEDA